ncbi:hypothetical protein BKA82DRAFT_4335672 [Pisolithus tinctorius]|nr:hypothetical protein BKA82DRAFT_4335672 [Pisolithus tinctorius]
MRYDDGAVEAQKRNTFSDATWPFEAWSNTSVAARRASRSTTNISALESTGSEGGELEVEGVGTELEEDAPEVEGGGVGLGDGDLTRARFEARAGLWVISTTGLAGITKLTATRAFEPQGSRADGSSDATTVAGDRRVDGETAILRSTFDELDVPIGTVDSPLETGLPETVCVLDLEESAMGRRRKREVRTHWRAIKGRVASQWRVGRKTLKARLRNVECLAGAAASGTETGRSGEMVGVRGEGGSKGPGSEGEGVREGAMVDVDVDVDDRASGSVSKVGRSRVGLGSGSWTTVVAGVGSARVWSTGAAVVAGAGSSWTTSAGGASTGSAGEEAA